MKLYKFNAALPFQYNFSGKFTAPNAEWMHMTRQLWDFEMIVVTRGTLYIADQDTRYTVGTGQYLLMPPTPKQHGFRASDCAFYWLHFQPLTPCEVLEGEHAGTEYDSMSLCIPQCGQLQSLERLIVLMKQLNDSERRYGLRSLNCFQTSAIIAEVSAQSHIARRYDSAENDTQLYNDVVDYITLNICSNLRVADVAEYFGYNVKYLSACFRKWAKMPLKQFILQKKMERAKAELSETNHSVAQIGYNLGYSDPHNFSAAFRRVTGLTPSGYRESYSRQRLNQV